MTRQSRPAPIFATTSLIENQEKFLVNKKEKEKILKTRTEHKIIIHVRRICPERSFRVRFLRFYLKRYFHLRYRVVQSRSLFIIALFSSSVIHYFSLLLVSLSLLFVWFLLIIDKVRNRRVFLSIVSWRMLRELHVYEA